MKTNILAAILAACILATASLPAQALPPQDEQALQTALNHFSKSLQHGQADAVVHASMPPAMLTLLANKAGMDSKQLEQFLQQQTASIMQQMQLESFHYDMAQAKEGISRNGKPYMLIPYQTVFTMNKQRQTANSHILALKDQDTWYLLRVNQAAQLKLIQEAYPELSDLTLPEEFSF